MTSNDTEQRNGRYFALFYRSFKTNYVKVTEARRLISAIKMYSKEYSFNDI